MKMRIVDGVVVDLAADPATMFHPSVAEEFVDVPEGAPDDLRFGYQFDGVTWTAPPEPAGDPVAAPTPAYRTLMTPIRFKAQFSVVEQVSIKRARTYQGDDEAKAFARDALDILFGSLDDPRLIEVDVADQAVIGGIEFCQSIGILTAERAETIKLGLTQ